MTKKKRRIPWLFRAKFTCPECQSPLKHGEPIRSNIRKQREPNTLAVHEVVATNVYLCDKCGHEFTGHDGLENMKEKYYPDLRLSGDGK